MSKPDEISRLDHAIDEAHQYWRDQITCDASTKGPQYVALFTFRTAALCEKASATFIATAMQILNDDYGQSGDAITVARDARVLAISHRHNFAPDLFEAVEIIKQQFNNLIFESNDDAWLAFNLDNQDMGLMLSRVKVLEVIEDADAEVKSLAQAENISASRSAQQSGPETYERGAFYTALSAYLQNHWQLTGASISDVIGIIDRLVPKQICQSLWASYGDYLKGLQINSALNLITLKCAANTAGEDPDNTTPLEIVKNGLLLKGADNRDLMNAEAAIIASLQGVRFTAKTASETDNPGPFSGILNKLHPNSATLHGRTFKNSNVLDHAHLAAAAVNGCAKSSYLQLQAKLLSELHEISPLAVTYTPTEMAGVMAGISERFFEQREAPGEKLMPMQAASI